MTLKEAYVDLIEQLLDAIRACETCKGEAIAKKDDDDYLERYKKSRKLHEEISILLNELIKAE